MITVNSRRAINWPPGGRGVACPECGCHHTLVLHTRRRWTLNRRERQCRSCGFRFATNEILADTPKPGEVGDNGAS